MAKHNQCLLQEREMTKEADKALPYGATNQSYPDPPSSISCQTLIQALDPTYDNKEPGNNSVIWQVMITWFKEYPVLPLIFTLKFFPISFIWKQLIPHCSIISKSKQLKASTLGFILMRDCNKHQTRII